MRTTPGNRPKEYLFDTASELGRKQMEYLEHMLDGPTRECLAATGVRAGQRCLDIGAGGGSITRWLAERVRPGGTVVSVDLDIEHLPEEAGVRVYRHDINDGPPEDGPYDLIHARLVLMHLARREEILTALVDALAPGGKLVIGEFTGRPRHVLSAPSHADEELFERVQHIAHDVVARQAGVSLEWAAEVGDRMAALGLEKIHSLDYSQTTAGGTIGCLLHANYVRQAEAPLLAAGLTADELNRYRHLLLDPRFRAWFYQFVCTTGSRPEG